MIPDVALIGEMQTREDLPQLLTRSPVRLHHHRCRLAAPLPLNRATDSSDVHCQSAKTGTIMVFVVTGRGGSLD